MKKKVFLSLLCGVMVLGLATGCGGNNTTTGENNSGTSNSQNNNSGKNYEIADELDGVVDFHTTTTQACFSSPGTLVKRERTGFKSVWGGYYVVWDAYLNTTSEMNYGVDISKITRSSQVIKEMEKQFLTVATDPLIRADNYDYKITEQKDIKINGFEMTKFKGTFTLTHEWKIDYNEADFVGYSIMKDGKPLYFVVVDIPTGENRIDIEKMADKIVKSFRDNDGDCYDD